MKKTIQLTSQISIPILGFGTWKITGDDAIVMVKNALQMGYRHIDTADVYSNHKEVGKGIKESAIDRKDIFLTTKVWRDNLSGEGVISSAKRFLSELQTDYIDLLLVHWPNDKFPLKETLQAMQELQQKKVIRAIGVSNFTIPLLEQVLQTNIPVVNNQVEFHPSLYQKKLKEFADKNHIVLTAYSPIAQGADLKIPLIRELSRTYGKTPSQIVLNWIIKKHIVVIPRSSKNENARDNLGALDFKLSEQDNAKIDNLGVYNRISRPPFAPFKD